MLHLQGPSPEARAAVQSCRPMTPAGPVVLDPEPDVREVLLLSEEFRLDELLAVLCVQIGQAEVRMAPPAAAAAPLALLCGGCLRGAPARSELPGLPRPHACMHA